ncbi:hypothetical protein FGADI_4447 [Fusarium gaditjirri]|uniref:Uncharacterized protein n=1 Tax=Fusarium gaditjirri TaxID=282569 RepID=A0A8H4TCY8_9HYPO|nr:hypothetical protein FGADI_4447 [Fusarium gaditjirri]
MASFNFKDLPTEIRQNVILNALPSVTVPHRYYLSNISHIYEVFDEQTLKNIVDTHPDVASLSNCIRSVKAIAQDGTPVMSSVFGVELRLDPKNDTFKAMEMRLPAVRPSESWNPQQVVGYHKYALPFENIVNVAYRTWLARGRAPPSNGNTTAAGPSTGPVAPPTPPNYYNIPFHKDLPIFARLPKAKNLSLIVEYADREWHIDGFQIRRIPADTGIAWDMPARDMLSNPEDLEGIPASNLRHSIPNIGLHGYSRGALSLGGNWAGFRFYPGSPKIEFSPLSWEEVEPLIGQYYGIDERGHNTFTPGFVARVWIIQSQKDVEETEKPHHCWVEVSEPQLGDPEWVEQVAATWKMTRQMLSHVGDTPIEGDNDRNVTVDNYCFQMEP